MLYKFEKYMYCDMNRESDVISGTEKRLQLRVQMAQRQSFQLFRRRVGERRVTAAAPLI